MNHRQRIFAFIDSQNLNLGIQELGWKLDFKRFYRYLKDSFRVSKAFLFIGYVPEYKHLYDHLTNSGYLLVFKPTTRDKKGNYKGNIDAELVLHAAKIQFPNYDKAICVSGDGDFYCLYEELRKEGKLGRILVPNSKFSSSLLRKFNEYKTFLNLNKNKLAKKVGGVM